MQPPTVSGLGLGFRVYLNNKPTHAAPNPAKFAVDYNHDRKVKALYDPQPYTPYPIPYTLNPTVLNPKLRP